MLRCLDVLKRIETYSPWNALLSYLNGEWTVRTRWVNTECTLGEWLVNRIWWVLMNDESVQRINRAQTRQQSEQQMHGHWYVNALWWQEDQFFWIAQELSSHCIYMYNVYSERMVSAWWAHDEYMINGKEECFRDCITLVPVLSPKLETVTLYVYVRWITFEVTVWFSFVFFVFFS